MPSMHANGVNLYYEVHGDGAPILGIHGTPSSALMWEDAAQVLAGRGRCIIYDRRGYLRSQPPEPFDSVDLDHHVGDAVTVLGTLATTPAVVIGRSTGGLIALALAHHHPDLVRGLVLLEPGVFTVDAAANEWAGRLRHTVLQAAAEDPGSASETVVRAALGDPTWESFPEQLRELFAGASAAVLAEVRGRGLDLSQQPLRLNDEELAGIPHPTLVVSSEDSPEVFRRVSDRLAGALPHAERVSVTGGHVIDPAHPAVLDFVDRVLAPPGSTGLLPR